ncbi:glycosyltransferase, partial [Sphingomonas sp.]|uniref:glycosyltransferase n=1 Tax=Sphingomonas sp. TaxID=28214 RepID=UPI0028A2923B
NPPAALPPPALSGRAASAMVPSHGRHILGVGRLEPQKRWDRLIAAMAHLPEDVGLTLLGEGSLRPALAAQIAALGLGHRVSMPGHSADAPAAMVAAHVLALPSDYEGVPGVLREALAVGTPVVATDSSPAVAEIVASPALGSIVARDDAGALVAALTHWLDHAAPRPRAATGRRLSGAVSGAVRFDRDGAPPPGGGVSRDRPCPRSPPGAPNGAVTPT